MLNVSVRGTAPLMEWSDLIREASSLLRPRKGGVWELSLGVKVQGLGSFVFSSLVFRRTSLRGGRDTPQTVC